MFLAGSDRRGVPGLPDGLIDNYGKEDGLKGVARLELGKPLPLGASAIDRMHRHNSPYRGGNRRRFALAKMIEAEVLVAFAHDYEAYLDLTPAHYKRGSTLVSRCTATSLAPQS